MATVGLKVPATPAHVRTARLVAVAAARRAGLPEDLLDELRLGVGEACARAVSLHLVHAPDVPISLQVTDGDGWLTVTVADAGPPPEREQPRLPDLLRSSLMHAEPADPRVPLAFLAGLVDDLAVTPGPDGTTVRMRWPLALPEEAGRLGHRSVRRITSQPV
jgi:anti-sigma regulatory factor (Ser/Thr protein kinase)